MATNNEKSERFETEFFNGKVRFEFFGEEMIEKIVNACEKNKKSGRIYLPPEWVGKKVKIVKC